MNSGQACLATHKALDFGLQALRGDGLHLASASWFVEVKDEQVSLARVDMGPYRATATPGPHPGWALASWQVCPATAHPVVPSHPHSCPLLALFTPGAQWETDQLDLL